MANSHIALHLAVTIDATNNKLDYDIAGAAVVTIDSGTYDHMGDVLANLETKLQAVDATFSVVIDSVGKPTIARGAGSFDLPFSSGANAASSCGATIGFAVADLASAASYTADYQHTLAFYAERPPLFDSKDRPLVIGPATFVSNDGSAERTTYGTQTWRRVDLAVMHKTKFFFSDADTNEDFETFWKEAAAGTELTLFTDTEAYPFTEAGQYVLQQGQNQSLLGIARLSPGVEYYGPIEMVLVKQ